MASKMKSLYVCQNCGYENPKWYGKCPQCGEWDTMQEEVRVEQKGNTAAARAGGLGGGTRGVAQKISEIQTVGEHRYHTGLSEFDRVLGGGHQGHRAVCPPFRNLFQRKGADARRHLLVQSARGM